jgi:predicted transcriptional regulator
MKANYAFIIMVKEKWWLEFCRRRRDGRLVQSYVQFGRAPPKNASLLIFYVSKPVGGICGYAEFVERRVGKAGELWEEYGKETVFVSSEEYFQFVKGRQQISFIRFKNLQEAVNPMPFGNICSLLGVKRLARRGLYVDREVAEKIIDFLE